MMLSTEEKRNRELRRKTETMSISENIAGRFGPYGGRYVPETLVAALEELDRAYGEAQADAGFHRRLDDLL